MIRRLLIANRGEIAVRIARAARASGIVPLGVYSAADVQAAHLAAMDDAFLLGPAPAPASYLAIDRILAAAHALEADAVHPGYGFLSERAPFARAVRDAGLTFVGPSAEAIAALGDKSEAKRRAREQGVPVIPGYDADDGDPERLREAAARIGPPLMIKASAGGGGRGMRLVEQLADFDEALAAARREAQAAFGDDRMLLERYVARPRHIEFQILADEHGTMIHLGERECSIQRRHQKVIEEAPSVALDDELRARMGDAAIRVARSVGYTNAGTAEFLLDEAGAFYFLEMNARLQVEHPVTELVHGVDVVRLQLAIAGGAPLTLRQSDVVARGWAIEARITAEDPHAGYLPATGIVERWEPPTGEGLRLDAGVTTGSEVSVYYDSLLAKLIAFAADRSGAVARLASGLDGFRVAGLPTNLPLLRAIAASDAFVVGDTTTAFLAEHPAVLAGDPDPLDAFLLAAGAILSDERSWRVAQVGIPVRLQGWARTISAVARRSGDDGEWRLAGDLSGDVRFATSDGHVLAEVAGRRLAGRARVECDGVAVEVGSRAYRFEFPPPPAARAAGAHTAAAASTVVAPMPGTVLRVAVHPGNAVGRRDLLIVLEAMKMEHRIEATADGVVAAVHVHPGSLVRGGAPLIDFET